MKHILFLLFIIFFVSVADARTDEIVIRPDGPGHNHGEHFDPIDIPEVYYDGNNQEIIIVGDGYSSYYEVKIISMTTMVTWVDTTISGYGDSINAPTSATYHVGDDTLSGNGLNNMLNKHYPNICFSTSCQSMPFDVLEGYNPSWMNFGESFTTGKDYGGPAYMGNTRGNGFEMANLGARFAKNLHQGISKIGMAYTIAKVKSFVWYYNFIHNLLGDPEFEMWTDIPCSYSNIVISRTDNAITISGIDAMPTIMSYYNNDGNVGTDTISTSNITINNISPNSTIMLYKHNYIPYIAPLMLQNVTLSNSQYVIASDMIAGNHIDINRTNGDVIVPNGVKYEIEASGEVKLMNGFSVEKGATFAIYPSRY